MHCERPIEFHDHAFSISPDPEPTPLSSPSARSLPDAEWTIIIPFFNEEGFLCESLCSAAAQDVRFDLVLVDNGSTDSSCDVAQAVCERLDLDFLLVKEPRPGKVHALARGLSRVRTKYVATFDADTIYPPDYLATAARLLGHGSCVAGQAYFVRANWPRWRRFAAAAKLIAATWLLPHQCHTGGAGQVFRTNALRESGGFDARRWDLILEDHEIIHRVSRLGRIGCGLNFFCSPSRRERDFPSARWSFLERLAYHLTPARLQSRFFYGFLAPRLEARRPLAVAARERRL